MVDLLGLLVLSLSFLHTTWVIFLGQAQRDWQEVYNCSNSWCWFVYDHSPSKSKKQLTDQFVTLSICSGKTPKWQRPRPLASPSHMPMSTTFVCAIEEPTSQCQSPSQTLLQLTLSFFCPRTSSPEFRLAIIGSDSKHPKACSRTISQIHVHSVSILASWHPVSCHA